MQISEITSKYEFKISKGDDLKELIPEISKARLELFKEFPYLYEGTYEDELKYLNEFVNNPKSIILTVHKENKLIAFVTATAVESGFELTEAIKDLMQKQGLDTSKYFYISEMMVYPEFRSFELQNQLKKDIENYARENSYTMTCFLSVFRENNHPLRPQDYKEISRLWKFNKYRKTNISVKFEWNTVQKDSEAKLMNNQLDLWEKELCT